jgi:hypothetical protein
MTYYIFLKYLRSLEEFRKILMSKFLLNLLLQIFIALVNSKIQFLIQKFFFLISARPTLRPIRPLSPASPLAAPPPQAKTVPTGPSSPRVGCVFVGNTSSLLVRAFQADRLSHVSLSTRPQMSVSSPTSSRPTSPAPPPSVAQLRASGAIEPLPPRLHFPSLNFLS